MTAWTPEEEQRRRRRKRLIRGLLIGGAAIGIPALVNASIARRARRLEPTTWGRRNRYAWSAGDVIFQRLGEGDPIVLLHSFGPGHDSLEWRAVAERLAARHQVFALDFLGFGRSDKPALHYDGELFIELTADFLEDVVRRRAVVVASGLSAAYAVQIAVDHPELISALALVCPLGIDDASDEPDLKDAIIHRLLRLPIFGRSALNVFASRNGIEYHLRQELFHDPERVDPSLVDHLYRGAHEEGAGGPLAAFLAGYLNHRIAAVLRKVAVPLWIAWGREAVNPPVESADLWLHAAPDADLEVLPDAGVLPHAERPEEFARRLSRFLERHSDS
ncbi:MAG: alpha/beta fold hydrolase [Thermoanaerobaculia bacterium]